MLTILLVSETVFAVKLDNVREETNIEALKNSDHKKCFIEFIDQYFKFKKCFNDIVIEHTGKKDAYICALKDLNTHKNNNTFNAVNGYFKKIELPLLNTKILSTWLENDIKGLNEVWHILSIAVCDAKDNKYSTRKVLDNGCSNSSKLIDENENASKKMFESWKCAIICVDDFIKNNDSLTQNLEKLKSSLECNK